jgi:hypothetical protein
MEVKISDSKENNATEQSENFMDNYHKIYVPGVTILDNWLSIILSKNDYDKLIPEMHIKLSISKKTFYNYRFGKTKIPHAIIMLIASILKEAGYDIYVQNIE